MPIRSTARSVNATVPLGVSAIDVVPNNMLDAHPTSTADTDPKVTLYPNYKGW